MSTEGELDIISATSLRSKLSQFSFATPSSSPSPSRRSSRLQARSGVKNEGDNVETPSPSPTKSPSRKRKSLEVHVEVTVTNKARGFPSKKKKGYSAPEVYAHLDGLTDRLGDELDVLFCGINPGKRSAEVGFHYAHRNNQFWRCIHQSGWTDRQLDPSEEHILPGTYNVGLTDLVERPTSNAEELARTEFTNGVPGLLAKVKKYRPHSVCFVGMDIGNIVEKGLEALLGLSIRGSSSSKKNIGLLRYKIVHSRSLDKTSETLFFVIPSTSGLATTYKMEKKVEYLAELRKLMQDRKAGTLDTSQMIIVPTSSSENAVAV